MKVVKTAENKPVWTEQYAQHIDINIGSEHHSRRQVGRQFHGGTLPPWKHQIWRTLHYKCARLWNSLMPLRLFLGIPNPRMQMILWNGFQSDT